MSANCGANAAAELRSTMCGRVLTQGDLTYEAARTIWNGAVNHHPALIAVCETVEDVQAAVRAARAHHLPLTVLSGGYDWAGRSSAQGGLVIDLSAMKQVIVDAQAQTAAVQGGATAADVVASAAAHGMTAVVGAVGKVGMAGFTLAGGYGPETCR